MECIVFFGGFAQQRADFVRPGRGHRSEVPSGGAGLIEVDVAISRYIDRVFRSVIGLARRAVGLHKAEIAMCMVC